MISEIAAYIIKLAPRNTEAITSKSEEGRPKQMIEQTKGRTRVVKDLWRSRRNEVRDDESKMDTESEIES